MIKYIGGEFILSSNNRGLTVQLNEAGANCCEFFKWSEIQSLFKQVIKIDYKKLSNEIELIMMYRGCMPEQGQLISILKKYFRGA